MKTVRQVEPVSDGVRRSTAERLGRFARLHELLERRRADWTKEHPDQWVAVSEGGVEAVAATQDELLGIVGHARVLSGELIIDLLETNPPRLAL